MTSDSGLRQYAIDAYYDGLASIDQLARIFQVHVDTMRAWVTQSRLKRIRRVPKPQKHASLKLSHEAERKIIQLVDSNPNISLLELQQQFPDESCTAVAQVITRYGITLPFRPCERKETEQESETKSPQN